MPVTYVARPSVMLIYENAESGHKTAGGEGAGGSLGDRKRRAPASPEVPFTKEVCVCAYVCVCSIGSAVSPRRAGGRLHRGGEYVRVCVCRHTLSRTRSPLRALTRARLPPLVHTRAGAALGRPRGEREIATTAGSNALPLQGRR
jgi:hypothetical protein